MIRFAVEPVAATDPVVGLWLAILDDARERTAYALERIQSADLDAPPVAGGNSIGMILYHLALTDLNWCYDHMLQQPYPAEIAALFPHPLLDTDARMYPVAGWSLEEYRQRLDAAREQVHAVFRPLTVDEFRRVLTRTEDDRAFEVTPEAILRHLTQHEAEHRGEIQLLLDGLGH